MRRMLRRYSLGIQLGEYQLTDHADGIAILAPSTCLLQEALIIQLEEANIAGMQISWPKTKLMAITPNPTNHLPLKICNNEVLFVDSFTYVGSLITNDGYFSRDITYRFAKAASAMCGLSNPIFRKHGCLRFALLYLRLFPRVSRKNCVRCVCSTEKQPE